MTRKTDGPRVAVGWAEQLPGGNWRARWHDADGRKRGTTRDPDSGEMMRTKKHAERVAYDQQEKTRKGLTDTSGRAPTWGMWKDEWLSARVVEHSTEQQDKVRINRYLEPQWGHVRLNQITRPRVQKWVNQLAATPRAGQENEDDPELLSPSTIQRIYHLFSASMKAAVLDERVPLVTNPCTGIVLQPAAPGHERYLTRDEVNQIAYFLRQPYQDAWLLLVGTGLRFGELAGLHWQRVDLTAGTIDVIETWDPAGKAIKGYPKGKKRRTIPIAAWLRPILEERAEQGTGGTCGKRHRAGAKCRSGLVVTAPEGGPLDGHNLGQRDFADAVKLAKLDGVRLHDARHTFASWLVQAGVSLQEVQRLLGHASITTTQRYSHLGTSQHAAILAALG